MVETIQDKGVWNAALQKVDKVFRLDDYVTQAHKNEPRSVIDEQILALAVSLILTGITAAAILAYRKLHSLRRSKNS